MTIWTHTAAYFAAFSVVHWLGFWLYARALLSLGRNGGLAKSLFSFIVYLLFAALLVSPLFIAFSSMETWRLAFNEDSRYTAYFLIGFLIAPLPGGLYFRRHYLHRLRNLGYFKQ